MNLSLALHPKPELVRLDTSLRYTDILFGFVIREIFLRLQYWQNLDRHAWLFLGVCLALVLGSWIGYRRSLNRSSYEVKFFNLPFFRFLLDQGMVILYFQTVNSTSVNLTKPWTDPTATVSLPGDPHVLATETVKLIMSVFVLYLAWDALGIWMALSRIKGPAQDRNFNNGIDFGALHHSAAAPLVEKPRYPDVKDNVKENKIINDMKWQEVGKIAITITAVCLALIVVLFLILRANSFPLLTPGVTFVILILLLILYRLAKEIRSTWGVA